jgi:D-glycerate 3-kinase
MSRAERTNSILEHILPSIKSHIEAQQFATRRPFILGLTGLQGCGKSTLASDLVFALNNTHKYNAVEISLDDFYLPHAARQELRKAHPDNKLLSVRGQPGTHDVKLARWFFDQFSDTDGKIIEVPFFDKSLFLGDGDRVPRGQWRTLSRDPPIDIVVFEGWCVGFQPLPEPELELKLAIAKESRKTATGVSKPSQEDSIESRFSTATLADHGLDALKFVNEQLGEYCAEFMGPKHFDFMVHLDTDDLVNVYTWRMEQERVLRKVKGTGMTDDQVVDFGEWTYNSCLYREVRLLTISLNIVQGYMPSYETYLDDLRAGFFQKSEAAIAARVQLHILLDLQRKVVKLEVV